MAQAHSSEEWSDPRSNPLSSSLRSKRLTEGYYASLALVFKLIRRIQSFQYGTKLWLHSVCGATVTREPYQRNRPAQFRVNSDR